MTIHEALLVSACCDTEKDDCRECPLYWPIQMEDVTDFNRLFRPCSALEKLKLALAARPIPLKVEAPRGQG